VGDNGGIANNGITVVLARRPQNAVWARHETVSTDG